LSPTAASQGWLRYAWLGPAVLATALIGILCWAAWVYGYDPGWLAAAHGWWPGALATNQDWTLVVATSLLAAGLGAYWWPRRRARLPIALIAIVVLVLVAAALGAVSYIPCRGHVGSGGISFWILQLYVGQPPSAVYPATQPMHGICAGPPPLALQLGEVDGLGATLISAVTAGAVVWRQPLDRLQSRFASNATVFTGLRPLTLPLLRRLTEQGDRRPRDVIVIEPDKDNPLLAEARTTGARIVIGDPASADLLRPIISSLRGCALSALYALADRVHQNEEVILAAGAMLDRYQPRQDRQPHLVTLIDDPRHAEHWRGSHSGRSDRWFEDALSSAEATARALVSRVMGTGRRRLMVCGDSPLTVTILVELARRAWEQAELDKAAADGRATDPGAPAGPARLPLSQVTLLDRRSPDIWREYLASAPRPVIDSLPTVVTSPVGWRDHLLETLDDMDRAQARETAVIVTEDPPGSGVHVAGRVARLHPDTLIFVLASSGDGKDAAIFDRLHPFEPGLLVDGEVPEDTWIRVARHWHECYRLSHPVPDGHPKAPARVPWAELDPFLRQDNILQLRSILLAATACGRQWAPVHQLLPGSVVELSDGELTEIATAEHARWLQRRLKARRASEFAVPWAELPLSQQARMRAEASAQLARLESVGFVPAIPMGGPPGAACYQRLGLVSATRLSQPLTWSTHAGEPMHGFAGDWRVTDDAGNTRTVTDQDFQASHEPAGDGRWRRVGTYSAWRVSEAVVVRTKEGRATARSGDWIVEAPTGERWPVRDEQFCWSYRPSSDPRDLPGDPAQTSRAAAASSTTPPAIS
jgi:hypothetical protein